MRLSGGKSWQAAKIVIYCQMCQNICMRVLAALGRYEIGMFMIVVVNEIYVWI